MSSSLRSSFFSSRALISCVVTAVFFVSAPTARAIADKSYFHPGIDLKITFEKDGSAEVEEMRSFQFDGNFSWTFLEKRTTGQYGEYTVEYAGVWDADTGERLLHETYEKSNLSGVKWHYAARNETKRFLIKYRIGKAVQRYMDAAQFYWKVIGDSHAYIGNVTAVLYPPQPSPRLFKVFVHTASPPGSLTITDDHSSARVGLTGVAKDDFVELRVLLDPDIFPDASLLTGETHGSLLQDERMVTEEWRLTQSRRHERAARSAKLLKAGVITGFLVLAAFIALYIFIFTRYGREFDTGYDHDYERDPPMDIPPCVLPAILTQSGVRNTEMGKAFSAALIDSARLGYLEIRETEKKVLLFKSKGLEYVLTEKGRALLSGRYEAGEGERPLIGFEKDVLETVFREAGSGNSVTNEEIEKWARKSAGSKTNYLKFIERRSKRLRRRFEAQHFKIDDPGSEKARKGFIAVSFGFGLVFVAAYFLGLKTPVILAFAPLVILLGVILSIPLARRTREAAVEFEKWRAFKRFMSDFSAMKDAGPSLIPLWEHYLVYAVALGVADKLISNLKLVAGEFGTPVPPAVWFHAAATGGFGPGTGGLSSLDSMTASLSNLESLSSALSTSTSSGGGFSGGGGGGGGGGGSGAG